MLKALGLIALVVLILVGALMPLKYTARMHLPPRKGPQSSGPKPDSEDSDRGD